MEYHKRKFSCYWDQEVYEESKQAVKSLDFFNEDNGYESHQIKAIEGLNVGDSYSPGDGHVVTRVDQFDDARNNVLHVKQIDEQIKSLQPPAHKLNAWEDAKQDTLDTFGVESLENLPDEALDELYERGITVLKAIKTMMI